MKSDIKVRREEPKKDGVPVLLKSDCGCLIEVLSYGHVIKELCDKHRFKKQEDMGLINKKRF